MLNGLRKPHRYAVFISGSGSTLQALLEMRHQFEIGLVVCNHSNALGLIKARRFGVQTLLFENPVDFAKLHQTLKEFRIDHIVLAGFMKMIPKAFVDEWKDRMMNIHPSLLPAYPGLRSAERSWQDQNDMGVSIHQVCAGMDDGRLFLKKISLKNDYKLQDGYTLPELLLRQTEQHLLRELATRWI